VSDEQPVTTHSGTFAIDRPIDKPSFRNDEVPAAMGEPFHPAAVTAGFDRLARLPLPVSANGPCGWFVETPFRGADIAGEHRPKPVPPVPYGFVADVDTALANRQLLTMNREFSGGKG